LLLELDRALAALCAQNDAFANKVRERRAGVEQRAQDAAGACQTETAQAEEAIAALQAELEQQRSRLEQAASRRDELLRVCQTDSSDLGAKQLAFERAFVALHGEYAHLKQQLCAEQL
jgi:chromosome segregation ATPase